MYFNVFEAHFRAKYLSSCKRLKLMEMTAWLPVACDNCYIKLTFQFGPIRFSVGTWTESRSYKF